MTEQSQHAFPSGMVQDLDGVRGTVLPPSPHAPGPATQVVVQLESGQQVVVAAAAFVRQPDGTYCLPLRLAVLPPVDRTPESAAGPPLVLPVIEEVLDVHTRRVVTGTVRITKTVQEREVLVDEPLWCEDVEITRVPVQRVVDGPIPVRTEGDTTIISLVEEVLVIKKRLMLVEELHLHTRRRETRQPQQVTLRRDEVHVERLPHATETHEEPQKEQDHGENPGGLV
jgi:uncharacterized protein (TIGR02271 family)